MRPQQFCPLRLRHQLSPYLGMPLRAFRMTSEQERTAKGQLTPSWTSSSASSSTTFGVSATFGLHGNFLFHHIDDLIRDSEVLDGAASDVALGHSPETVTILLRTKK